MTANQLQFQKNKIDEKIADEQARHNETMEFETERSNKEKERLQEEANKISEEVADETKRHNQAMEDIQSEYNKLYLEWQRESGERKLQLEQELNEIKARQQDEVERHNQEMEQLSDRETTVKEDLAVVQAGTLAEQERHNAEMELLEQQRNTNTAAFNAMQGAYWNGVLSNEAFRNQLESNRVTLDTYKNRIMLEDVRLKYLNYALDKKVSESTIFKNYSGAFTNFFNTAATTAIGGLKLF